jgi:23S rRNA (pseudouridine1915-N3)-methyltransferase
MRIKIINTQKVKEKYVMDALEEYAKRLSVYCKIEYIENRNPSKIISNKSYIIKIDTNGELLSSEKLAGKIEECAIRGNSDITILLGNANNIQPNYTLAISKMDFDIGILLIIIYEQIYRAFRIITNAPYHK